MRKRDFVRMTLCVLMISGLWMQLSAAPVPKAKIDDAREIVVSPELRIAGVDADAPQAAPSINQVLDKMSKRELDEMAAFEGYTPIIETYIQNVEVSESKGTEPKSDVYFLGQADLRGKIKVHSMIDGGQRFSWNWSFDPAGFLQMIYADRGSFDRAHYEFTSRGRAFLGEVRCMVFEVKPLPKTKGARFFGKIWVEDQDLTIVRMNGYYSRSVHFSWKTFSDEYYLHFDSWRTNVKPGLWLPAYIYSQELSNLDGFHNPSFKSATHFWGYKLKATSHEEEMNRLLIESPNRVKEEEAQHDRSPLEAQREWRHEAEKNILDLLERHGLLAPTGEVDKVLNTIVNNIEVTNNFDEQIDLHCRVLLTTNLEVLSVGNTIMISRGLIDVIPNEETLAALIAYGMADALLPKPYQEQYGFSDILRLSATEVLKRLSFEESDAEVIENSKKAMELLKKSPYASKLANAGLFLKQLQTQIKELKQLISPQLGNQVYFEEQLIQSAPTLKPDDKSQIAALPLGSRLKIDAWNAGVSLSKPKPISLLSGRDKMPFEVTPLPPYLTRFVVTSQVQGGTAAVASLFQ